MKFRRSGRLGYGLPVLALVAVVLAVTYLVSGGESVLAQTPSPGELAATRIVANAQEKADAARRKIDAPTATLLPTRTPTEIPTATDIPTSTPLPAIPTDVPTITIQRVVVTEVVSVDPTIAAMNRNAEIERLKREASIAKMWNNIGVSAIGFALILVLAGIMYVVYVVAKRMGR